MPVGLPSFFRLTTQVMSRLGVPATSSVGVAMAEALRENDPTLAPPLDQVFGMLQREYSRSVIDQEVRALLKVPRKAATTNHESILALSTGSNGKPFVVTTNFDLMFEKVDSRLSRWSGPQLPSLVFNESPAGIVYLHGRLTRSSDEHGNLILSSGDFGRAYLADGWSTTFMRELLERRVVVLLGYSAGDPPIRYLLEGLAASSASKLRSIYAFAQGSAEDVRAKWSELGIVGIGFTEFSHLWNSLEAWASRSRDRNAWAAHVLSLARTSPRTLLPFQRGQVAALVATSDGAKSFSEASPPPPSEWLFVFDKGIRYAKIERARPQGHDVDLHANYGLDDDPPRVVTDQRRAVQDGIDLLSTLPTDLAESSHSRLSNLLRRNAALDVRLQHLVQWFARVLEQPSAVWWTARQSALHPVLLAAIRNRLTHLNASFPALDNATRKIWSLLLEALTNRSSGENDLEWVALKTRIRAEGWTGAVLREFQDIAQPYVVQRPALFSRDCPPVTGELADLGELVRFDVETSSRRGADIEIPDSMVRQVARIMRGALERAVTLLDDVLGSHRFYRMPAISPARGNEERTRYLDGLGADFLWLVELCERLLKLSPSALQEEVNAWPVADGYFFSRLQLHFWREKKLFDGRTVGKAIDGFPDDIFFNPYLRRELLHLLKARWKDFSAAHRQSIERRVLRGRQRYDGEPKNDYAASKKYHAGTTLGWLQRNRIQLSTDAKAKLAKFRSAKDWAIEHERGADHDWDSGGGWVTLRKDPGDLSNLPLGQIAARALELSSAPRIDLVEERPFIGLVENHPVKAFLALTIERRHGRYPTFLWRQLFSSWPASTSDRLFLSCVRRLGELSVETVVELRYDTTRWIARNAARLYQLDPVTFWSVWDSVFNALCEGGENATASAVSRGNDAKGNPAATKTVSHAINGPIGNLIEALFNTFGDRKFDKGEGFPPDFCLRVRHALGAPGDGASHAAILLARQLNFLYYVDGRWFRREILPHLMTDDPLSEAFWAGLVAEILIPRPSTLFKAVKPHFLRLFHEPDLFHFDEGSDRNLAQMLVQATFWNVTDQGYVTFQECRDALRTCSESGRHAALWFVEQIVAADNNWERFGRKFFELAWPRELNYRTSSTTEAMVRVATSQADRFPDVVQVIQEYLTFVDYPDTVIFGLLDGQDGDSIAARSPRQTLDVLTRIIRLDRAGAPFQLGTVLDVIAEADEELRTHKAWRDLAGLCSR
jgi:hypothetical protein